MDFFFLLLLLLSLSFFHFHFFLHHITCLLWLKDHLQSHLLQSSHHLVLWPMVTIVFLSLLSTHPLPQNLILPWPCGRKNSQSSGPKPEPSLPLPLLLTWETPTLAPKDWLTVLFLCLKPCPVNLCGTWFSLPVFWTLLSRVCPSPATDSYPWCTNSYP